MRLPDDLENIPEHLEDPDEDLPPEASEDLVYDDSRNLHHNYPMDDLMDLELGDLMWLAPGVAKPEAMVIRYLGRDHDGNMRVTSASNRPGEVEPSAGGLCPNGPRAANPLRLDEYLYREGELVLAWLRGNVRPVQEDRTLRLTDTGEEVDV